MTERTPPQVNASLDNAWALIRELQDGQRAHARSTCSSRALADALHKGHCDLCLRVSQNHEAHEKALASLKANQNQDAARVSKLEAAAEVARLQRDQLKCELMALTERVEQIDTVLDHDTSQMRHATLASILDSLIKRIDALELSKRSEPSPVAPIDPRFGSGDSRPHEVIALFNGLRTKLLERYGVSPEVLNQIDLLAKEVASKFSHGGRQWWQT